MSRGGARRKDKLRRDLRLVTEHLRHGAAPFKDCPHTDVGWTFSPKNLPAVRCRDCHLVATGGAIVLARQIAAGKGTQPPPPSKSPTGTKPSGSSDLGPLDDELLVAQMTKAIGPTPGGLPDQDPLTTQMEQKIAQVSEGLMSLKQAAKWVMGEAQHVPPKLKDALFGIPIVSSPTPLPSSAKMKLVLEALGQGLMSKHQAESILGLPISDEPEHPFTPQD